MPNEKPWSAAAIRLLKGPVYKKQEKRETWENLITYKSSLDDYFGVLGLRVFLEAVDGYAFLEEAGERLERGMEDEDEEEEKVPSAGLPHLIRKTPLSYSASMLCVLLRYEIEKFETSQSEADCAILRKSEIAALYRSFTKDRADEIRQMKALDSTLRTLCRLTYLFASSDALSESEISDDAEFELSPILKARIDTAFMKELLEKMKGRAESKEKDLLEGDDGR
jgi:hypothetical protein